MKSLDQYALAINDANAAKGFWPERRADRNFGEVIALMHAETVEAWDGFVSDAADDKLPQYSSLHVEVIDILIRALDACGAFKVRISDEFINNPNLLDDELLKIKDPALLFLKVHSFLSEALEANRKGDKYKSRVTLTGVAGHAPWQTRLAAVVALLVLVAEVLEIPVDEIMDAKLAFNVSRPLRHGAAY